MRIALRLEFKQAAPSRTGRTILYVTHDQIEAMSLADRIARAARRAPFQQIDTPDRDLSSAASTRFVARFIGAPPMNILDAAVTSGEQRSCALSWPAHGFTMSCRPQAAPVGAALPRARLGIAVRARGRYALAAGAARRRRLIAGAVTWVEHLGPRHILDVRLGRRAGQGGGAAPTFAPPAGPIPSGSGFDPRAAPPARP